MSGDPKDGGSDDLSVELTPEQLGEAERRLRRHECDPGTYSSWEEVKRRLEK